MIELSNNNKALKDWKFGKYIDGKNQKAYLIIKYKISGKVAKMPLVLYFSDCPYPKIVMKKLLDAGADIDPHNDLNELTDRLLNLDVVDGRYLTKAGVHEDYFVLGNKIFNAPNQNIILDDQLVQITSTRLGKKGNLKGWQRNVAKPAENSSYLMFGIATSLSAPIYANIMRDEGVIFNLAGTSGLGKTTTMFGAQSVMGPPMQFASWNTTPRGICEALAASSDTLFIIDDWEKIDSYTSISKVISTQTHLMTEGSSKTYSRSVRNSLPDYTWNGPILTSGPFTVEEQAKKDVYRRSNGDRRRMIDILVEVNGGNGIFDNLPIDHDSGKFAGKFRKATTENYGVLINPWLKFIYKDRDAFCDSIQVSVDFYCENNRMSGDLGFEQTITKKFAIVFAAGKEAIKAKLLPWDINVFEEAIIKLHNLSRNSIRTQKQILNTCILDINRATSDDKKFRYVTQTKKASFANKASITGVICESGSDRHLYITLDTLHKIVGGKHNGKLFIDHMVQIGACVFGPSGRTCIQAEVKVGSVLRRPRMLKIELNLFDREVEKISA